MRIDEYGDPVYDTQANYGNAQALQDQLDAGGNRDNGDVPTSRAMDSGPAPSSPAPSGGGSPQLSPLQQVQNEYQKDFGRAATGSELASEKDNLNRYAFDTGPYGGVKQQIDKRMVNAPNDGRPSLNPMNQQQSYQQYQQAVGGGQPQGNDALTQFMQYLQAQQARSDQERAGTHAILMTQLGKASQPVSVEDPTTQQILGPQRVALQRAAERRRSQLAASLNSPTNNLGSSGAFDSGLAKIEQNRGEGEAGATGQVLSQQLSQRAQQLNQLLAIATQSGDNESARSIAAQLDAIRAQMQGTQFNQSLNQNQNQFQDSLGYNYNALNATQNSGALSALLSMLGGG